MKKTKDTWKIEQGYRNRPEMGESDRCNKGEKPYIRFKTVAVVWTGQLPVARRRRA